MLRGLFTGAIFGTILSVVALATASMLGGQGLPSARAPGEAQVDVAAVATPEEIEEASGPAPARDADPVLPSGTPPPAPISAQDPAVETAGAPVPATSADPARPVPAPDAMDAPVRPASVEPEEPVLIAPDAEPAGAPASEAGPDVVTLTVPVLPADEARDPALPEAVTVTVEPVDEPAPEADIAEAPAEPEAAETQTLEIIRGGDASEAAVASAEPEDAGSPSRFVLSNEQDTEPEAVEEAPIVVAEPGGAAREANAEPFENPQGRPVMAIILRDALPRPGAEALAALPFVMTVAVDAEAPDAAEVMRDYRSAGIEVLATSALPRGATAGDAATSVAAWTAAVPEAVGLLETAEGGFAPSRDAMTQVVAEAARSGHLMLTFPSGLNAIRQEAERMGVPSGLVFRSFDAAGETPDVMRRFLDQAAFRATRGDGVVMLGTATEETIAALTEWAQSDRAQQVLLAPISAVVTD